jgi:hypothetical protein
VIKLGASAGIRGVFNRNRSEAQLDDLKFQSGVKWTPIDATAKNRISQNQQFHSKTIFIRVYSRPFAVEKSLA